MDMNAFATTRAATTPQTGAGTGVTTQGNTLAGGNGVFSALNGLNFIDLIFARISEGQDLKNDTAGIVTAPAETAPADILTQLITPDTETISTLPGDLTGDLSAISSHMQQLRSYLDTLLNGLPAEQRPQIVEIKSAEFKQILNDLQADLNAGDPTLIATGLTPEKLSTLMTQVETAEQNGMLDQLIMVKIVPPATNVNDKPMALLLPRALVTIQEQAQTGDETIIADNDTDSLVTVLNKLMVDGETPKPVTQKPVIDTLSTVPGGVSFEEAGSKLTGLDRALDNVEGNIEKHSATGKKVPSGLENAAEKIKTAISAGLSTVAGNAPGSMEASASWQDVFPEGMDTLNIGINGKPMPMTSAASMTSLVTSAPQATYPHPATQAIAATITKAAAAGEDKAFTIKLDPPELGRVEVKMMIDKHNAVKAHLVIEKPETFMMLQRDAQILERSLQGIGLETGDGGLSFELAQDNMFQNEGERGGERYQSGKNAGMGSNDSADTVIESTMTWYVDQETGMQRYNILV